MFMRAFTGLLVLLASSAYGLDSICDATQDAACYGALGGRVYLQLMRNTRGHDLRFHNEQEIIFKFKNNKTAFYGKFNTPSFLQRWQFVPDNGTLIINPAEKRDSGTYRVEIHNPSGKMVGNQSVLLITEAPVSDVDLPISCLANGEKSVRCSSNGDSLQYSWSLGGRPLSDADADLSTDKIWTLLLNGSVTGELTCTVRNHVSSRRITRQLNLCSGASTTASVTVTNHTLSLVQPGTNKAILVSTFLVIILVCLCIAMVIFYKRKTRNTHTPVSVKTDPEEVVYTQVTTISNARGKRSDMQGKKEEANDVVYSDVAMVTNTRRKSRKPPAAEAYELEYAEVSAFKKQRGPTTPERPAEAVEYGEVRVHMPC